MDELLNDCEKSLEVFFKYTLIKNRFTYFVYGYLKKHGWPYVVVVFEDDHGDSYYDVVAIMFNDEKGYFRVHEIPYPIIVDDAENSKNEEVRKLSSELLIELESAYRVPRVLWGRFPLRDIYETVKRKKFGD